MRLPHGFNEHSYRAQQEYIAKLENIVRERDRADAQARLQKIADQKAEAEAKEAAERAEAHAAYLERSRRASWVVHNLDAIIAGGNGHEPLDLDRFEGSIPKSGWPEGDSPDNYSTSAPPSLTEEGKPTAMHQLADKLGMKL